MPFYTEKSLVSLDQLYGAKRGGHRDGKSELRKGKDARETHVQSSCLKTSLKNGTPASMP